MPLYEYLCPSGHMTVEGRAVDLRGPPARCTICGEWAGKVIATPPRVFGDLEGYESPASGRWIEGKRARREDFARTGCRALEAGDHEKAAENRRAAEAKAEREIDEAVMRTAGELGMRTT